MLAEIEGGAFMDCKSLKRVVLNEGLTTLGEYDEYLDDSNVYYGVFSCGGLEEITLPSTLTTIGDNTFSDCYNLRVVWVEDGCAPDIRQYVNYNVVVLPTTVGDRPLQDLRRLKEIVIPEGVEKIGEYWFSRSDIESVIIPESVQVIEEYAFYKCRELRRTVIPKGVVEIQSSAFKDCKNLKEVVFEEGSQLEKIGYRCFASTGLEEITLPKMLKEIGSGALFDCNNLKVIYTEDGCEANLCDSEISDTVKVGPLPETMIGNMRIWDLRKLKDVTVPDGAERIGNQWFWRAEIEKITVPVSVQEIGTNAFCECKKLREIVFEEGSKLKVVRKEAFGNCKSIKGI